MMLDINYLKENVNNVNMNNLEKVTNNTFDYLFNQVSDTKLGTKLGELLASYKILTKYIAMVNVKHQIDSAVKSRSNGLNADVNYLSNIIDSHLGYYFINGNGLPVQMAPSDIKEILKDVIKLNKKVINY